MFLKDHPISIPQIEVSVDWSLHVQLLSHEVQDGLFLVESSMALINVQYQSPVTWSSRGVDSCRLEVRLREGRQLVCRKFQTIRSFHEIFRIIVRYSS